MTTALAKSETTALDTLGDEFPVERLVRQKQAIQKAMKAVMKDGEHYGIIPGTPKPSLWQPGADTLCFLFRLRADYEPVSAIEEEKFIAFTYRCRLYHIDSGQEWGSGVGSANSREKKYSAQSSAKLCPKCGKPAIIRGKAEYGGGWLCFQKKDGCGAKFKDGDESIEKQTGEVQAAGVWDLHNTIGKMACKRAKVAAVLTATAASDCFTQDLEDLIEYLPPAPKEMGTMPTPKAFQPELAPASSTTAKSAKASAETAAKPTAGDAPKAHATTVADPRDADVAQPLVATATSEVPHDPITGEVTDAEFDESDEENLLDVVPVYDFNERTQQFEPIRNEPRLSPAQLKKIQVLKGQLGHHLDSRESDGGIGLSKKTTIVKGGKYRKHLLEKYGKEHSNELSRREATNVIDRLVGHVERLDKKLDRGNEDIAREPGSDG